MLIPVGKSYIYLPHSQGSGGEIPLELLGWILGIASIVVLYSCLKYFYLKALNRRTDGFWAELCGMSDDAFDGSFLWTFGGFILRLVSFAILVATLLVGSLWLIFN